MKTLYFEGAGWSDADISKTTIGNCRIHNAFHFNNGRAVYPEINGTERTKQQSQNPQVAVHGLRRVPEKEAGGKGR